MQLCGSIPCCPCRRPDDLVPEQLAPATSYAARALAERRFLIYVSPPHPISCTALRAMRDLASMCHVIHVKVQEDITVSQIKGVVAGCIRQESAPQGYAKQQLNAASWKRRCIPS